MSPVAMARLSVLASDLKKMNDATPALQMLIKIIALCGSAEGCTLRLPQLAKETGIPHTTMKSWMKHLASASFIEKKQAGPEGMRVTITDLVIRNAGAPSSPDTNEEIAGLIKAARLTTDAVFEKILAAVRPKREDAS